MKKGAPTKYKDSYDEQIIDFFDREPFEIMKDDDGRPVTTQAGRPILIACQLPTFESFAHSINVHRDTLYEWCDKHPSFSDAKKRAQQLQFNILVQNGLSGGYNSTFAIFTGKAALGMRDGNEVDQGAPKPLTTTYEVIDARIREDEEDDIADS